MSSHMPWFRIRPVDVLTEKAFRTMSPADLGVWLRCACLHMIDGGVPWDFRELGRALGIRPSSAEKYLPMLRTFFVPRSELPENLSKVVDEISGDLAESQLLLYSIDLLEQIAGYRDKCLSNQANGSLGGRPKRVLPLPIPESDRFLLGNLPGVEKEKESEKEVKSERDAFVCLSSGREEAPPITRSESQDPLDTQGSPESEFPWDGIPVSGTPSSPDLNPSSSASVQDVVSLFRDTAREVGLPETSPEKVQELTPIILTRVAKDGWLDALPGALAYMRSLGRSWWTAKQPNYALPNLLEEGKVETFAQKWALKQQGRNEGRTGPEPTKPMESLEVMLGPHKSVFDALVLLFGPKLKPLPAATLVRDLLAAQSCTPQQLIQSAKLLRATCSESRYMPSFDRWIQDRGYLVCEVAPQTSIPTTAPSRGPIHRAEADAQGKAQFQAFRARKKAASTKESSNV